MIPTPKTFLAIFRARAYCIYRGAVCLLLGILCGCGSPKFTQPPRTGLEQLLISCASEQAMHGTELGWAHGKKIFVEDKYFESYDKGYAISLIRQSLAQSGALLMNNFTNADLIVEIRSAALSMDTQTSLLGIPSFTLPLIASAPVQTPELAIYKSQKADSIGKFALFAYQRQTGEFVDSSGPSSGKAHFYYYKLLGISWEKTDVPEFGKHPNITSAEKP